MPGYKDEKYYAPEQNDKIDTLDKRFIGLSDTQIGLFALPTIVTLVPLIMILLNKNARFNPIIYIPVAIGAIHLYHHYTLARLQNKYVK